MPDLNGDQFHQPRLPGMAMRPLGQQHVGAGEAVPEAAKQSHVADYHGQFGVDSAWLAGHETGVGLEANPLYDKGAVRAAREYDVAHVRQRGTQGDSYPYEETTERDEIVPTWQLTSPQAEVNRPAVDHLTANANMLDLAEAPTVSEYADLETGEVSYMVEDGNHRMNAAQRQGRLFVPSTVYAWRAKARSA